MSLAVRSYRINEFIIQSLDGSKTIDISNSVLVFDYFEDLLSPCVTATAFIMNSTSLFNLLPIRGGERVSFNVSTAFGDFVLDGESGLYVDKITGLDAEKLNEKFTLHMVSREALTNETSRCETVYRGNIQQSVIKILKDDLKTTKYDEKNIERTSNEYTFYGNTRKPFSVLTWLGPKSVAAIGQVTGTSGGNESGEAKGTSGFLFYENKNGFNFRSIDTLVSQTQLQVNSSNKEDIPLYTYRPKIIKSNDIASEYSVLNFSYEKNNDLMRSLRVGMYVNKTYFYDLYTNTLDIYKYNLKNEIKNKLGTEDSIAVSNEFGDSISRVMVRVNDRGAANPDGSVSSPTGNGADMAKSYSRYNLLFTQALNMVVPCNVTLYVGQIIKCELPRINRSSVKEMDELQSGLYLIKELRHHFEGGQMVTSLRLVRDSYGLYGPKS